MKAPVLTVVAAALCALAVPVAVADPALTGYPSSMASAGDSTRAFNTCSFPFTDCPANSWSTGTSSTAKSRYRRILEARCTAPVSVPAGSSITFRAVDVNGNIEATRTLAP